MSATPKALLSLNQRTPLIGDTTKRRGAEKRSLVGNWESEYLLSDFRCLEYVHVYAVNWSVIVMVTGRWLCIDVGILSCGLNDSWGFNLYWSKLVSCAMRCMKGSILHVNFAF